MCNLVLGNVSMERLLFSKIELWVVALIGLVCLVLGIAWSAAVLLWDAFPSRQISEIRAFVAGVPGDNRPLLTRLAGSIQVRPNTFPAYRKTELLPPESFVPMTPAAGAQNLPVTSGLRIAGPNVDTPRYFVAYGSFYFPEAGTAVGAIAFDSTGTVYRGWPIRIDRAEFPGLHIGLDVAPDGTIATNAFGIFAAQSWCGAPLWQAPWTPHPDGVRRHENGLDGYDYHHDIFFHDGAFWTFRGADVVAVDAESGALKAEILGADMVRWGWNDDGGVLDARADIFRGQDLTRETAASLLPGDPFHFNKVEVLSAELAPNYPGLEAGDLLLSVRDLNLVAIVRPSEERFVWWRYGLTSRQHDATFRDGAIEVFNNAPFSYPPQPSIRRLDFETHTASTIFDLTAFDFEMRFKGNFEREGDRLLVVDDESGKVIAARLDGTVEMVFQNGYSDDDWTGTLQLRNATEISADDFANFQARCQ